MNIRFNPGEKKLSNEIDGFLSYRENGKIPFFIGINLLLISIFIVPFQFVIINFPGPLGFLIRKVYYKFRCKYFGENAIVSYGCDIDFPKNISLQPYCFIDHHVTLTTITGYINIGRRVHVAPYSIICGVGGIEIGDYAGIGAFARIYSHSETPIDGLRLSGPMIPEKYKGMITKKVIIGKDALIGTGAVVLPGAIIGEGSIVTPNSLVPTNYTVKPWTIVSGIPVKLVGLRKKVNVPDI